MGELGPRLVVAGTHSGVGKTTVATGLMAALQHRGLRVGAAKVGPDYIDPGYHALAVGHPSRNLDAWICGTDAMPALAGRAARDADVLVIEGVMGLFDGAADGSPTSTADLAHQLDAPVLLVVDASSMSASVAAVVHGYATLDRDVRVAGVILNRVGSESHEALLREALDPIGLPVVGAIHRDPALGWRDRHLGLVPVVEQRPEVERALDRLAATVARSCDLEAIEKLAAAAPVQHVGEPRMPERVGSARIAVAGGEAFSFLYPDNLEALEAAGAEIVPIDPAHDAALPDGCSALIAGGGFPEVHAEALSTNEPLLADLRARIAGGLVVWAECGGLLWLARSLDGHPMAGVIEAGATMTDKLTLGYRAATTLVDTPLGRAGLEVRGHEFHYSTIDPAGGALDLSSRFGSGPAGFGSPTMLASYLHLHLGNAPELAAAFVQAAGTS